MADKAGPSCLFSVLQKLFCFSASRRVLLLGHFEWEYLIQRGVSCDIAIFSLGFLGSGVTYWSCKDSKLFIGDAKIVMKIHLYK